MKAMRKAACYMMAVALLCAVFSMGAMAAEAVIDVESNLVTSGDTTQLVVVVSIPADFEMAGASVRLSYDSSKLTVINSEVGTLPSALVNTEKEGEIRGNFFGSEPCTDGGILYTVTFEYAADAVADATDISVGNYSLSDIDGNTVEGVGVSYTFAGEEVAIPSPTPSIAPEEESSPDAAVPNDSNEKAQLSEASEVHPETDDVLPQTELSPRLDDEQLEVHPNVDPSSGTELKRPIGLILLCGGVLFLAVAVLILGLTAKRRYRGKH